MSGDFHRTVMGHRFYEGTMPELVAQLRRLNDNFEKAVALERTLALTVDLLNVALERIKGEKDQ